jgi:hypothetical protein
MEVSIMKRIITGVVLAVFIIGFFVEGVEAERKKRRRHPKGQKAAISAQISPTLGKLKWGMSEKDVLKMSLKRVRDHFNKLVGKTKDPVEDDRLRTLEREKIKKIKESLIRFDGQSTGWDVGFLADEFTHNNGESMVVMKDSNSQNFYFFIDGRLWKWYKALDINVFAGKSFQEFADAMQRKFGKAKVTQGELVPGGEKRKWLEWEDKTTRLRAIDQTAFYGFYCLVFEEKKTLKNLASLRRNASERKSKSHALVDSVTSAEDVSANPDMSPNVVDRITGKTRQREELRDQSGSVRDRRSGSQSPSKTSVTKDDDPLSGLDF